MLICPMALSSSQRCSKRSIANCAVFFPSARYSKSESLHWELQLFCKSWEIWVCLLVGWLLFFYFQVLIVQLLQRHSRLKWRFTLLKISAQGTSLQTQMCFCFIFRKRVTCSSCLGTRCSHHCFPAVPSTCYQPRS